MLQRQAFQRFLASKQKDTGMLKSLYRIMKIDVSNKGLQFTYRVDILGTTGGFLTPQFSCPPSVVESHLCLRSDSGVSDRLTATTLIGSAFM